MFLWVFGKFRSGYPDLLHLDKAQLNLGRVDRIVYINVGIDELERTYTHEKEYQPCRTIGTRY
jgi:hypothetical protein